VATASPGKWRENGAIGGSMGSIAEGMGLATVASSVTDGYDVLLLATRFP
jgi:hypothetical protein